MDAAYYPSTTMVRRQRGVLELVAASASEDHVRLLGRNSFTYAIIDLLQTRASQRFLGPFSAAELHAKLLSNYAKMIRDRNPEKETVTSFPSPLHLQISGNALLPSILLANIRKPLPFGPNSDINSEVNLVIRLNDDSVDMDSWVEWIRAAPIGVKDVKVEGSVKDIKAEGPLRNTFR